MRIAQPSLRCGNLFAFFAVPLAYMGKKQYLCGDFIIDHQCDDTQKLYNYEENFLFAYGIDPCRRRKCR